MGLEDRIRKLEAAAGQARQGSENEETARRRRVMSRLYFERNNARRQLDGLDPLPTPPELRETKDEVVHALKVTLPHYRQSGGWQRGEGKEFLDAWQDRLREKLANLERSEE